MRNQSEKPAFSKKSVTAYHEITIGKTLYRVTSVYKGEIDLRRALEDLTVRKALGSAQPARRAGA